VGFSREVTPKISHEGTKSQRVRKKEESSSYIFDNGHRVYLFFHRWLQKKPEEVSSDDVTRYLAFLDQRKQHSAATLNFNLSAFKFFYCNVIKRYIVTEQKRPKRNKRLPVVLSKSEEALTFAVLETSWGITRSEQPRYILTFPKKSCWVLSARSILWIKKMMMRRRKKWD